MEIIFVLMMLFAGWVLIKILKFIFWVLFSTDDNKTTSTHSEAVVEEKEPELKYKNAVYISFRRKVYKAFEAYKKDGYIAIWDSDLDGFIIPGSNSLSAGAEIYSINVEFDEKNLLQLKDPYYVMVSYGIVFKKSDFDRRKKMCEHLNKFIFEELKKPGVMYNLKPIEGYDFGIFYFNIIISNNKALYEGTKKLGEAELFKQVFCDAKKGYLDGLNLYRTRCGKDSI
jgi:hypothetical protein